VLMITIISACRVDIIANMFSKPIANVNTNVTVVELANGTANGAFLHRCIDQQYLTHVTDRCESLLMLRERQTWKSFRKFS